MRSSPGSLAVCALMAVTSAAVAGPNEAARPGGESVNPSASAASGAAANPINPATIISPVSAVSATPAVAPSIAPAVVPLAVTPGEAVNLAPTALAAPSEAGGATVSPAAGGARDAAAVQALVPDALHPSPASSGDRGDETAQSSVRLNAMYSNALGRANGIADPAAGAGVSGVRQGVRRLIDQKVVAANGASPLDAPALYADAIKSADQAKTDHQIPGDEAAKTIKSIRAVAAGKADASVGLLVQMTFQSAAIHSEKGVRRALNAFDQFQQVGGLAAPLLVNRAGFEDHVRRVLGGGESVPPRVWVEQTSRGRVVKGLPGGGVPSVDLSALMVARDVGVPAGTAQRAVLDAANGRELPSAVEFYREIRANNGNVGTAALAAGGYWARSSAAAVGNSFRSLAGISPSRRNFIDPKILLSRDASLASSISEHAAATAKLMSGAHHDDSLFALKTFQGAEDAARAYSDITGDFAPRVMIQHLHQAFLDDLGETPTHRLSPSAARLLRGDGGLLYWLELMERRAAEVVDARVWSSDWPDQDYLEHVKPAGRYAVDLRGVHEGVQTFLADNHIFARGSGASGEVRLQATLPTSVDSGQVRVSVEKPLDGLGAHLESVGFLIDRLPSGQLRAEIPRDGIWRDPAVLSALAQDALAAALGAPSKNPAVEGLLEMLALARGRTDASLLLALRNDPAVDVAPLLGLIDYPDSNGTIRGFEAVGPVMIVRRGRLETVAVLRNPDTGAPVAAVALRTSPVAGK